VARMYENRWPRPGPGMVVVFAVVGLIVGILVGLFNASNARGGGDPSGQLSDETSITHPSGGDLPESFYTVVVNSIPRSKDRAVAEARAEVLKGEGVEDVGVLDPSQYSSLAPNFWAVYSGVFKSQDEAAAHRDQLRDRFPDLRGCYLKIVTNQS
jgi:hypothetical protein